MDETKILLGKVLGEIYRLQNANGMPCPAGEAQIFGLLHGFEHCIKQELETTGFMPEEKVNSMSDVLDEYFSDDDKLKKFKGFYDIEHQLESKDIDRCEAIRILTYLKANHQFTEVIEKMDTSSSPCECRTFNISESCK